MVGNSLQNMNLHDRNYQRAKSSTQNRTYTARITRELKALERNATQSSHRYGNVNMSATALSQIPPKTNVPVLDEYYQTYNTAGQIGTIRFIAEFERLSEKIEKFWKLKSTPRVEVDKVRSVLLQMRMKGERLDCPEAT